MQIPSNFVATQNSHQAATEQAILEGQSLASTRGQQSEGELKKAFQDFVGQTFYSEMLKAFRATQKESAYFHGGRAEEIFQGQLDQVLTEKLSESSADKFADPMFELFSQSRAR